MGPPLALGDPSRPPFEHRQLSFQYASAQSGDFERIVMTERFRPLLLLLATAALLMAALGATIVADPAQALPCRPGQCPEEPAEEPPVEEAPGDPDPIPGPRRHRVLVVNVGWGTSAENHEDAPLYENLERLQVDYINGRLNDWFAKSAPPGAFPGWTATPGGSYTIRRPNLPSPCTEAGMADFAANLINAAEEKLERAGIDFDGYNLVAIVYSRTFCFEGRWGSNRVLLAHSNSTTHEFGHYLGLLEHASSLYCRDADGMRVPLSKNCEALEYGDPFDAMGNTGNLSYNAMEAKRLGWLNGQFINFRAPETGSWMLRPFIVDDYDHQFGVRAMRVQDGPTTLWIEYRVPQSIDGDETALDGDKVSPLHFGGYGSGVFIRREVSGVHGTVSQLLDMTPRTPMSTPSLELGQTWANPLGEVTITLSQLGPNGATITIGNQRTATVPDLTGLDPERAMDLVRAAGLWANGWKLTLDPNCKKLGVVANQEPGAGTKAFPNSEVQFWVGEKDPAIPCP
jgi:hypothetical protein